LTGDGLFQFQTRISSRKSKKQSKAICPDKNKSRLFQFETRTSSRESKKQSKAIRPDEKKAEQQHLWLLRSSVCLFKEGGWHYY
jgi:hypothetical protein